MLCETNNGTSQKNQVRNSSVEKKCVCVCVFYLHYPGGKRTVSRKKSEFPGRGFLICSIRTTNTVKYSDFFISESREQKATSQRASLCLYKVGAVYARVLKRQALQGRGNLSSSRQYAMFVFVCVSVVFFFFTFDTRT